MPAKLFYDRVLCHRIWAIDCMPYRLQFLRIWKLASEKQEYPFMNHYLWSIGYGPEVMAHNDFLKQFKFEKIKVDLEFTKKGMIDIYFVFSYLAHIKLGIWFSSNVSSRHEKHENFDKSWRFKI